ncbi:hypothetical protein [Gimesia maris]|uniref:hypothetical protein n=1 Tax=Gimesia maris TaxID=122 RepID=UPI0012B8751D|nr:hypothetical protein [Gimesia maris]
MVNPHHNPPPSELIRLCLRFTCFGLIVCLLTGCFLGWPLLLAAAGFSWGMWQFCSQMLSDQATDDQRKQDQSR